MEYRYELVKPLQNLPLKMIVHSSSSRHFIAEHWHDSLEICYVLSGKVDRVYVDGREYEVGEGDILVINSNAIHSFSVNRMPNRKVVTFLIPNDFLKAVFSDIPRVEFDCISIGEQTCRSKKSFNALRKVLNALIAAYLDLEKDELASIKITGLTYELAYVLLRHFQSKKKNSSSIEFRKHTDRLEKFTDFIKQHYRQNLSLDYLAGQFNLSPEYFSRFFTKYTGMTVFQYINAVRLEKSLPELMNTDLSTLQIALNHGFPNEKSYNRVFKAAYQATAYQYRKSKNAVKMPKVNI
ncbi:AraC family transcriptional regulator [Saccharibacillus kuerlensis]|uniref:HTH araC/xylS-type domain-containing protein n=1 Tax=Saccharibacillus kuerlensis TaxID=459527 RepID=A0ABQ2KYF1_9BACL|nr:AraC family transcriptional regulator [Saccharibacillus kuerlensis]GGN96223.1 hypothetical protein GCM10010969_12990 [Saccharibacillus kuerlensis]